MAALYLVEFVLGAAFLYGVFTQIALPLWNDTPMFPMFAQEGKLEAELKDAKQGVVEAEIESAISRHNVEEQHIRNSRGREGIE
jgi:hypothetical protein